MFSSPVSIKLSCGMEFIVLPRRRSKPMSILLWEGLSAEAANGWPWHMVGAQNRSRNVCFVPKADIQAAFGYYCCWARVLKFVEHHP